MRNVLRVVNLLIVLLLVALAGAAYWYAIRPLPQVEGTLQAGLSAPATVSRDTLGVAHITAATEEDAVFLQGYVHAQDRLFQMDALRRLGAGELSEVLGAATLAADQEARRLRMRRVAEQHIAALPEDERRLFAAYARGVNHYLETNRDRLPVEFTLLGYDPRPWTMTDSVVAGLEMFRSLTTSWKDELLKQTLLRKGDASKVSFLFPVRTGEEAQLGSNAWVIAGSRTASGKPILANDTHLQWQFPGPWYLVHLTAGDRLNVGGFSLPGVPSVLIGHNRRIAWGITNLHFDVQDLYLEKFDPATGRYLYQGKLEQARWERDAIRVKNGNAVPGDRWVTRHGPVFREGNAWLALRWVAAEPGFQFPFFEIDRAGNWQEFRKALSRFPGPGSNFVYADVDGNIGYQGAGRLPIRKNHSGDLPADGSTGESEWDGYIPFDQLPSVFNPPSGMLVTANQNPFPEKYPYRVSGSFSSHYRSKQIEALLQSRKTGWKPEDMLRVQTDVYSAFSHFLAKQVVKAWEARGRGNASLAEPARLLREWNGQMHGDLPQPLLVTFIYQHLRREIGEKASPGQGAAYNQQMAPVVIERLLRDRPNDWFSDYDALLVKCFDAAVQEGIPQFGGKVESWRYGRYTGFLLAHPVISRVPYVGKYFNIGPVPMHGSSTTVKQTSPRVGPSMRFVADLSQWDNSLHNTTIGQSGQPFSKHFRDQWDAYYAGRSFPMQYEKVTPVETLEVRP